MENLIRLFNIVILDVVLVSIVYLLSVKIRFSPCINWVHSR